MLHKAADVTELCFRPIPAGSVVPFRMSITSLVDPSNHTYSKPDVDRSVTSEHAADAAAAAVSVSVTQYEAYNMPDFVLST